MKTYSVGEMARRMGIPTSTLRYYDKEGLLPFVERTPGGIRVFGERDYEYLQLIECLKKNTSKVKNIKKYMLAALFNAPATIDGYYQAEVNHDMPQFA